MFSGVKQGGILSPYLFNFYIDDLLVELAESPFGTSIGHVFTGVVAYADDILLLSRNAFGLQQMMNICQKFCSSWKLTLNPSKTTIVHFTQASSPIIFSLDKYFIIPSTSCSHLGLNWSNQDRKILFTHTQSKLKKVRQHIGHLIAKGTQNQHPSTIAQIIKVQLLPLLYGIEFTSYTKSDLTRFDSMLRACLKPLFRCHSKCSNILFSTFHIPSYTQLVAFRSATTLKQLFQHDYTRQILLQTHTSPTSWISSIAIFQLNIHLCLNRRGFKYTFPTSGLIDSIHHLLSQWHVPLCRKSFYDIMHINMHRHLW